MNSSSSRQLWLNLLLIGILTGFFAFVLYRLFFALNYNWNWSVIPTYMVRYDEQSGRWLPNILLQGLFTTIKLSIWGMLLAGLLGLIIGILRTSKRLFFRLSARTFVELIRNTPPLVLVFIFYFFVSDQLLPAIGADTSADMQKFRRNREKFKHKVIQFRGFRSGSREHPWAP